MSRVARVPRSFPPNEPASDARKDAGRRDEGGGRSKKPFSRVRDVRAGRSIVPAKSLALAPVSVFASLPLSLPLTRYGAITG